MDDTHRMGLWHYGFTERDLYSPRNGIILAKAIAEELIGRTYVFFIIILRYEIFVLPSSLLLASLFLASSFLFPSLQYFFVFSLVFSEDLSC